MMLRYIAMRLLWAVLMLFALASMLFLLVNAAPGDPVQTLVGGEAVSDEFRASIEKRFGLDQPLYIQYFAFLKQLMTFDFGMSFSQGREITPLVIERLMNSFIIVMPAFILSTVLGIWFGKIIASRRRILSSLTDAGSLILYSTPVFFAGQLLVLTLAIWVSWFPVSGMYSARSGGGGITDLIMHATLPIIALSLREIGLNARITASSMTEVQNMEFITTGRAKGLSERTITMKYTLRNALMPIVTAVGYNFGAILGGSILVEIVFAWPGLGRLIYSAISSRDSVLLIACIMIIGVVVVLANLITDIVYTRIDPRVRGGQK